MALEKTIRLYLSDGTPTGPIVAEIINWTGQVIVVPRAQLHEMAKREELRRTGVYLLVGPDAQTGADRVYVGEADEVFERLKTHDKDESKDFWTRRNDHQQGLQPDEVAWAAPGKPSDRAGARRESGYRLQWQFAGRQDASGV